MPGFQERCATFAKIFEQILDSSIAVDYEVRHVFEDLLLLGGRHGVVDMTHDAIARRLNIPIEIIRRCISELEKPDPMSRSPDFGGKRIIRMNDHRNWGWKIVNAAKYRSIQSEEDRLLYQRSWDREHRNNRPNHKYRPKTVTPDKAPDSPPKPPINPTHSDAESDADTHTHRNGECVFEKMRLKIAGIYRRTAPWSYHNESLLAEISRRPQAELELEELITFRARKKPEDRRFFPRSVESLLAKWESTLDAARDDDNQKPETPADKELQSAIRQANRL